MVNTLCLYRPGLIGYQEAWLWQRQTADAVRAGAAEHLAVLQHPPVYSFGRRVRRENLLADPETLYRRPATRKVADFIGTMNFIPAEILSESGDAVEVDAKGLGRVALDITLAPAKTGESPVVGLRPETLTLLYDDQKASERETDGIIDEVIYFGDMTYYDVYLGGTDVEVRLSMRNVPGRPVLDVGTRVRVAWSPSALVLFR